MTSVRYQSAVVMGASLKLIYFRSYKAVWLMINLQTALVLQRIMGKQ